ncbi:MAG: recombination mediator RecR [bacterium]|jgi:recombination protein RecR|nr:recombination mediator RecR [bacterium]
MATDAINRLVSALNRLPGVGAKSARRIALDMLTWETDAVRELAHVMVDVKNRVKRCSVCFNLTEVDPCEVCTNPRRDVTQVMVVDYVGDLLAVERTGLYRGHYHVLDGRISPLDGISAEDLNIQGLLDRVRKGVIQEVILANGPTVEGDATAQYLAQCLIPLNVKTTQVARGLPVGSDLALADQVTLSRALEGRREY